MTDHPQVHIRVGTWEADVDAGAANHIRRLWHAGIPTLWSCQGRPARRPLLQLAGGLWYWLRLPEVRADFRLTEIVKLALVGDAYVAVARVEDVERARALLPPRYAVRAQ